MCSPFDPLTCSDAISKGLGPALDFLTATDELVQAGAQSTVEAMFAWIADGLHTGIASLATLLAGWILVPSTELCPGSGRSGDWVARCATSNAPAAQLRAWILPLTILIATAGLIWQGIMMAISRKGEPLLQAVRGLWNTALWGAVGIAGTQLALKAGDSYSYWILQRAIFGDSPDPVGTMGTKIADIAVPESGITLVVLVLLELPILFVALVQILLMIFREGAVVILAGVLELAAAGSFTQTGSRWLHRVVTWLLALVAYKPVAATVYGVAFLLMGSNGRNFVMGLAVMVLSIVALPALMKFFTWTTGAVGGNSGGLSLLGTGAAAGVHAAASMRGIGGFSAADHARYLETNGPSPAGYPTAGAATGGTPTGAGVPSTAGPTTTTVNATSTAGATGAAGTAASGVGAPIAAGLVGAEVAAQNARKASQTAAEAMQGGQ